MTDSPLTWLADDLRCVLAPNPSPMTFHGTNTYLLGRGEVVVIDPGPNLPDHQAALLGALDGAERIVAILVTHAHLDHSPLARPLAAATGAPIYAFGPATAGRSAVMARLAAQGGLEGGEGLDQDFAPDQTLADLQMISVAGYQITALWTPGHLSNHLCFSDGTRLFCGDHVMGWSTSLVSPPDGDLTAFMTSCETLLNRPERPYFPGHGAPIADGPTRVAELIAHRRGREAQIRQALDQNPGTAADLARRIYTDVAPALLPAATRNVLAHLIDLHGKTIVTCDGDLSADSVFRSAAAET